MIAAFGFAAAMLALAASPAAAHELRPAYLELRESASQEVDVLWKTPMRGEMRLALAPVLSGPAEEITPVTTRESGGAAVQNWRLRLAEPLRGRTLHIDGLSATMTDALVRVEFADGTNWVARLTPQAPSVAIPAVPAGGEVARTYFSLGLEHILLGVDHLLFVLALMLVTTGARRLAWTITAFTVAHSITLALATLGVVRVPSAPVEAVIALSIAFVAAEVVRATRGEETGWTARAPWLVAFAFGLLHGLGFAGALAEIGLPQGQIPLALLFFNVGVEAGQLAFVAAAAAAVAVLRPLRHRLPAGAAVAPPYAIGVLAMYWVIERVAAFW